MPAVTADTLTLPRLVEPDPTTATDRAVTSLTTAPRGFEGEGFPVHRAFAGVPLHELDPFIHMDQMGEVEYAAGEPKGTPWHPHRGFETVTYMIDGVMVHQDSHGGGGVIADGATQWMTAGSGLLHIETPPEWLVAKGGLFHGIQLWVNLPAAQKMVSPNYQGLEGDDVTLLASPDGGALVRLIAGDLGGHAGPGSTRTPITMAHLTIAPGAQVRLPWTGDFNGLVYGLAGNGTVGADQRPIEAGQLAVTAAGDVLTLGGRPSPDARTDAFDVLVLGGRRIGEPVQAQGPFVMNTRAELLQAFQDYEAGKLGVIPPNALGIR
ncbi:pirin family protein [Aquihabitans sp. G128]|uniref:pirin family protein n=1 Tax=Aquihabitans sp. G128 TaxID=2849779 RepID=UPI001C21E090|nr:pirin family protein [Aquihabitans sp. G128]QXC59784.1 pirin family protein [Aquihabitans sp. G128]